MLGLKEGIPQMYGLGGKTHCSWGTRNWGWGGTVGHHQLGAISPIISDFAKDHLVTQWLIWCSCNFIFVDSPVSEHFFDISFTVSSLHLYLRLRSRFEAGLKRELLGASDSGIWWWRRRIWWRQWWQLTMIFQKKQSRACSLDSETRHFKVWHLGDLGGIIVKDFKDWLLQQISIRVWTTSHSSFSFDGFYMSQSQSNPFGEIYSILSIPPYIHIQTTDICIPGRAFLHFVHHCSAEGTTANIRTFSGTCAETRRLRLETWDLLQKNLHPSGSISHQSIIVNVSQENEC